jgi:hypothetical protein
MANENLTIKNLSSAVINGDVTSFKSVNGSGEEGEDSGYILTNSLKIGSNVVELSYDGMTTNTKYYISRKTTDELDNSQNTKYYLLLNDNLSNYLYYMNKDIESVYSFEDTNSEDNLFIVDKSIIEDDVKDDFNDYMIDFSNSSISTSVDNIFYNGSLLAEIFSSDLIYGTKSSDNGYIYLYLNKNANQDLKFDISDFIFEVRVNNIPTKFFEVSEKTLDVGTNSIYNVLVKINASKFKKETDMDELNYFLIVVKNKYTTDTMSFSYSKFEDYMKPFISYDSMLQTTDDITINCRYDLSIATTNQTNNVVVNINDDDLLELIEGKKRPVIDGSIVFEMTDKNINIRALTQTIVKMYIESSNNYYLISSNDINFEKTNYKCYSSSYNYFNGTKSYILNSNNSELSFIVESTTDIDYKFKDTFAINIIKIKDSSKTKVDNNDSDLGINDIECVITVNFNVNINPDPKFELSEDEESILKNIMSFQTDTLTAEFGGTSLFSIKANNNIVLNDSDLNSTALKNYISGGGRNLTYIEENFDNFDISFYGIYVDYMVLDNSEIGQIWFNKFEDADLTNDNPVITKQELVCNASSSADNCNDGFNENAFSVTLDGVTKRILIVPEDVFKLFNYLNTSDTKLFSIDNTTEDIFSLSSDEFVELVSKTKNTNNFAFYPYADLIFLANENDEDEFVNSNLYIDYYPVIHRLTKKTDSKEKIVWSIYDGENVTNLKQEKIIKLAAQEKNDSDSDLSSIATGELGTINDSNSIISYPSFVTFKVLMETDSGEPTSIDSVTYTGKITNGSEFPVLIKDISLSNIADDSDLFTLNEDKSDISSDSFMDYNLEIGNNCISLSKLNIGAYNDHSDLTVITAEDGSLLYLLKAGGTLNVNITNTDEVNNIPADFGKTINNLKDSLHFELYYIQENTDSDSSSLKYTFREDGSTVATNFETVISVYPFISSINFDSSYYRYGDTVYNIISDDIKLRSVVFRIVKDSNDTSRYSSEVNYKDLIDNAVDKDITENENDIFYTIKDISIFDMQDIYFLESGKDFSYRNIINLIKFNYPDKTSVINNAIGIQVIARTTYQNNNTEYDMVIIDNYLDLYSNEENFLPTLNRLTGSLYHLIKINNKYDDLYEYKIMVDGKEYHEGDIIYNKYANEIALHKFRLYYKPKFTVNKVGLVIEDISSPYNGYIYGDLDGNGIIDYVEYRLLKNYIETQDSSGIILELADLNNDGIIDVNDLNLLEEYLSSVNNIGKAFTYTDSEGKKITRYVGNLNMYLENGVEKSYNYTSVDKSTNSDHNINKRIYLDLNTLPDSSTKNAGYSDVQAIYDYAENIGNNTPSDLALHLADLNNDGKITEEDAKLLEDTIKKYGYLVGDIDKDDNLNMNDVNDIIQLNKDNKLNNLSDEEIRIYDVKNSYDPNGDLFIKSISDFTEEELKEIDDHDIIYNIETLKTKSINFNIAYYYARAAVELNPIEYKDNLISDDNESHEMLLGKYLLEVPFNNDSDVITSENGWLLADSFEGCIDGTKPVVPNLTISDSEIDNDNNYKELHKYSTLTRDELKNIIYNPKDNIISEVSYYNNNTNILNDISYDMKYEIQGTSGISILKTPSVELDEDGKYIYSVTASDIVQGMFQIENTNVEPINVEINQAKINDESGYPFKITSSALLSHTTYNNDYQPIYRVEPNTTLSIFIIFNSKLDNYSTNLNIRVQNNYKKKYSDDNIKWDSYTIRLNCVQNYSFNKEIIKQILPYKFYDENNEDTIKAEYYNIVDSNGNIDSEKIFNIIDVNNFNKNILYSNLLYLDDTLIYDSHNPSPLKDINDESYPLLVSKKVLDRKLYMGDHTLTLITVKFNGLINYHNYYITIIDQNVYNYNNSNNSLNYFKDQSKYYKNNLEDSYSRNSIILRQPKNEGYDKEDFENELFLDTNGDISMVTKDLSKGKKDSYYLYKFTEIIHHYMNFSNYIVDSEQYLFEKNYQEILMYYDEIKEQFNSYTNTIYAKLNKSTGELYTIINSIEYRFTTYDSILEEIEATKEAEENNVSSETTTSTAINYYNDDDHFISRLFYEDNILSKYKEYNILYSPDSDSNDKIEIEISKDDIATFEIPDEDVLYINIEKEENIKINSVKIISATPTVGSTPVTCTDNSISSNSTIVSIENGKIVFSVNNAITQIKSSVELNENDNHKVYVELSNTNAGTTYLYIFNLLNAYSSLKISDSNDIKFSALQQPSRTLTNTTKYPITFAIYYKNTRLKSNKFYSFDSTMNIIDAANDKCSFKINYQNNGKIEDNDDGTIITLSPFASCNITFTGSCSDSSSISLKDSLIPLLDVPSATTSSNTSISKLLETLNKKSMINHSISIKIESIGDKDDITMGYYSYLATNTSSYDLTVKYMEFNAIYLSDFYYSKDGSIFNKTHSKTYDIYKDKSNNALVLLINDSNEINKNAFGNFIVNGFNDVIKTDSNKFKTYYPFRRNAINCNVSSDNINSEIALNLQYNNSFNISNMTSVINSVTSFTTTNIFPMILVKSDTDNDTNPNISFAVNFGTFKNKTFSSMNNFNYSTITTTPENRNNLEYKKISELVTSKNSTYSIYDGKPNNGEDTSYKYGKIIDNNIEYFIANLNDIQIDENNTNPIYLYFNFIEDGKKEDISDQSGIVYHIDDDPNMSEGLRNLFTYGSKQQTLKWIYNALIGSDNDIDGTLGQFYDDSLLNIVNWVKDSYNNLSKKEEKFKDIIDEIYDTKSTIAVLLQNISNQFNQLNDKADVKEFKEWINENVYNLADFEYSISEIFADIYYLSDKGVSLSVKITDSENNETTKDFSFKNSLPLVNKYKYWEKDSTNNIIEDTKTFVKNIKTTDNSEDDTSSNTASNTSTDSTDDSNSATEVTDSVDVSLHPDIWNSSLITSNFEDDNYFIEKIWINPTNTDIDPIFYKKNFIETSTLLKNSNCYTNISSSIKYNFSN